MMSSSSITARGVDGIWDVRAAFFGDWEDVGRAGEDGLVYIIRWKEYIINNEACTVIHPHPSPRGREIVQDALFSRYISR